MSKKIDIIYKDYSLLGQQTKIAEEKGLVSAEWYTSPINRKRLKELMVRKDWPGVRDVLIWFTALAVLGYIAYQAWGTWWALPAFSIYGFVFYSFAHSRWHECAHYTAFKSEWLNEVVYFIVCFASIRLGTYRRWKHTRHHTDTQIVGRDPEINVPRPPNFRRMLMNIFNVDLTRLEFITAIRLSFGKLRDFEKDIIPATERHKMYWEARIFLFVYAVVIGLAIYMQSVLPLLYFGLPALYGAILTNPIFFVTEHGGLHEDVLDHRMCTRTLYMNPVFRFLQGNMNYHLEHHMFPMIPYHALPAMHQEIKHDCPEPTKGIWNALIEVYSAFFVQLRDPSYTINRPLPSTARPYSPNGPYNPRNSLDDSDLTIKVSK